MALILHCDLCGRIVEDVKDLKQAKKGLGDSLCRLCEKKQQRTENYIGGMKEKYSKRMDEMILEAKKELKEEWRTLMMLKDEDAILDHFSETKFV